MKKRKNARNIDYKVLWPEYFDSHFARGQGRRIPKKQAVPNPKAEDIARAAKQAGLTCAIEEHKSYPTDWFKKRGRVLVYSDKPKTEIIRVVASNLEKQR